MQKILCPIDFSPTALNALEYAVKLGEGLHATLTLLYVLSEEEFNKVLVDKESSFEDWKEQEEARLCALCDEINAVSQKKGLVKADYMIKVGELTEGVSSLAKADHYKLIVMGTGGASDLKKVYWGSNTIKVVNKSNIPVLCIPHTAKFAGFRKVVYATNYDKHDKEAIAELVTLSVPFDSIVQVVHVFAEATVEKKKIHHDFSEEMKSFVGYHKLRFAEVQGEDRVSLVLDEYMKTENGEVLSLMTIQRGFFENLFHQSVTKDISGFTHYPLLIFRKGEN
ncbi:universal stress protein [Cytophagales bacterium LB-30]|uniref:Universal stress protein n=1 Tax=Shiella aurantiaca TaxID=3058365 RepID=A0ABT8F4U0_9BACT|nr:universal stress protein [Shiella aurantiaca]MDN4165379.1 universal stress protein [Shiella aurantiaca]